MDPVLPRPEKTLHISSGLPAIAAATTSREVLDLHVATGPKVKPDYADGTFAIMRSFEYDISRRIGALRDKFTVNIVGNVEYGPHTYPMYQIKAVRNPANPYVHLSGIVHGDEEAGGKAILEFFETHVERYLPHFNFVAHPCVNPSGFETATLQAMNGYHPETREDKFTGNINRSFGGKAEQQEARIIEEALRNGPKNYLFAMDLHESPPYYQDETYLPKDAPRGCWLYETCSDDSLRIGRGLTDTLPMHIEACDWPTIYSDKADGGVIAFSAQTTGHAEYTEPTSLDGHIFEYYTPHSFTTETPTGWKLEKRIETHLHFLAKTLEVYQERIAHQRSS